MNALKLHYRSESKQKDFYAQFTYPIGIKVVPFEINAVETVKKSRVYVLLDLLDHFIIAERKIKDKPTSQEFVENMKNVETSRGWLQDRKEKKFDLCLSVIEEKVFPAVKMIVDEYELQGDIPDELLTIMGTIQGTIENK